MVKLKTTAGEQIPGADAVSARSRDAKTGQRRWKLLPPAVGV
ncbi:MAG: hypothetical protein ACKO2L_16820 [Planctomycetaceae bacterium]